MSEVNYGHDNDYAETRLRNTIVKTVYNTVVLIENFSYDEGKFYCTDILAKAGLHLDLEELDMNPVELGFVNSPNNTDYISRMPSRHYKQGLTAQTYKGGVYPNKNTFATASMAMCILGIYPKLIDCVESVSCGEAVSRGFSRNFSVSNTGEDNVLTFRGDYVGAVHFNSDNGLLQNRLDKKYNFLQEMLEYETAA